MYLKSQDGIIATLCADGKPECAGTALTCVYRAAVYIVKGGTYYIAPRGGVRINAIAPVNFKDFHEKNSR